MLEKSILSNFFEHDPEVHIFLCNEKCERTEILVRMGVKPSFEAGRLPNPSPQLPRPPVSCSKPFPPPPMREALAPPLESMGPPAGATGPRTPTPLRTRDTPEPLCGFRPPEGASLVRMLRMCVCVMLCVCACVGLVACVCALVCAWECMRLCA